MKNKIDFEIFKYLKDFREDCENNFTEIIELFFKRDCSDEKMIERLLYTFRYFSQLCLFLFTDKRCKLEGKEDFRKMTILGLKELIKKIERWGKKWDMMTKFIKE